MTPAGMNFLRTAVGYALLDCKENEEVTEEIRQVKL
jgi:hypothetical protein